MIILGVDPSLSSTGICLMSEDGQVIESLVIKTEQTGPERLAYFSQTLTSLISMRSKVQVFIEGYSFGSAGKRESMAELGGVIRLTLYEHGIEYIEVPPKTLKKFATGNGNADKIIMGVKLMKEFGLEYPTSDQTDAYWLSIFGLAYHGLIPNLTKERAEIIEGIKNPKAKGRKVKK